MLDSRRVFGWVWGGLGWTIIHRPERGSFVVLHDSGLFIEIDDGAMAAWDDRIDNALSAQLKKAVAEGVTGRHLVEVTKHSDESLSCRLLPLLRSPESTREGDCPRCDGSGWDPESRPYAPIHQRMVCQEGCPESLKRAEEVESAAEDAGESRKEDR